MDIEPAVEPLTWGPPRWLPAALAGTAVAALLIAVGVDAAGRVLLAVVAALALAAAGWLAAGPPLRVDGAGIAVRGVLGTHRVPWAEVVAVLADDRRRSRAVEVETTETLLAVPAILLGGISPRRVAELVTSRRPPVV